LEQQWHQQLIVMIDLSQHREAGFNQPKKKKHGLQCVYLYHIQYKQSTKEHTINSGEAKKAAVL